MDEEGTSVVDYITKFHNSLKEMRDFSSQLYNTADYWKSSFLKSQEKKLIIESIKDYIFEALLITIDHLGCLSANLPSSLSVTNAIPQTQHKIQILKQSSLPNEALYEKEKNGVSWPKQLNAPLEVVDPEIADIIEHEKARQWK